MEPKREFERKERDEIFSRYVNAGRRRYFFDVKATRADDYYLTITESTKQYNDDGTERYERRRLFLYKEDFDKFTDRMKEVMDFIIKERGAAPVRSTDKTERQGNPPTSYPTSDEKEESRDTEQPVSPKKSVKDRPSSRKKAKENDKKGESSEFTDVKFEDLG